MTRSLHTRAFTDRQGHFCHREGVRRHTSRRRGLSVIEALGAVTIGIIFVALSIAILADQNERERAIALSQDLALVAEGGENYLRANLPQFEDLDEFSEASTQADRSVTEVCLPALTGGGYLPSHILDNDKATNPYGLQIHLSIARLENAATEFSGKPDVYAVVAFTQGDRSLFSNKALFATVEALGENGGYGTGTHSGRSSVGWGTIYDAATGNLAHETPSATMAGPLWEFSGMPTDSDFPVIQNVGGCNTPATSVAIDLVGQAVAVQFVTIYPPGRITTLDNAAQQTLTTERFQKTSEVRGIFRNVRSNITDTPEYVRGCGSANLNLLRAAKDVTDPNTGVVTTHVFSTNPLNPLATTIPTNTRFCYPNGAGDHYIVPNAHMARLSVGSINAHTIEAMRLNIVTEDDNQGILKVHGDLKTPALHLGAEGIYLEKLTLDSGAKFKRFTATGPRVDVATPANPHNNDKVTGIQKINNLYINSRPWLARVCGYRSDQRQVSNPTPSSIQASLDSAITAASNTSCPISSSANN